MSILDSKPDPRVHAYRVDLADSRLRGLVHANQFVRPELRRCILGRAPLFKNSDLSGNMISELRGGELVDVYEICKGIAWVQNRLDQYVGYTFADALTDAIIQPNYKVEVLRTFLLPAPDPKLPPLDVLTLGCTLEVIGDAEDGFVPIAPQGWVCEKHLHPIHEIAPDYILTAERMLETPYLWGGRSPAGCDCSGLVQLCLEMAGIAVPRDSDQQCDAIGTKITANWENMEFGRGDILFMEGHVGFMISNADFIHANAHHMQVVREPLAAVMARGAKLVGWAKAASVETYRDAAA